MEQIQSQVSIQELPPEMLQMVLKNLDVASLLACRPVCRKLEAMSTLILHGRPETELFFDLPSDAVLQNRVDKWVTSLKKKEKGIQDFVQSVIVKNDSDKNAIPFTQFSLFNIQNWDESVIDFLSLVSPIASCLKLQFARSAMDDPKFTEKLRNLLFHETPKLKEFGLGFERKRKNDAATNWNWNHNQNQMENSTRDSDILKLAFFPAPKEISKEDCSSIPTSDPVLIKLPKLKVFHFGTEIEDDSTIEIFRDILKIVPNLERTYYFVIDPYDNRPTVCDWNDFIFFLECGKLHTLKDVSFDPTPNFLADWKIAVQKQNINMQEIYSLFKIEELRLCWFETLSRAKNPNEFREALHLAEQILRRSKNSLKQLEICFFEFPPGFSVPTFTKLATVDFSAHEDKIKQNLSEVVSLFPPGCRLLNIFPAVRTLNLIACFSSYLKHFFPREDSTPVMPSVHTILFEGKETKGEDVEIMALLCPNVKTLQHSCIFMMDKNNFHGSTVSLVDFPSFGLAVWKNMKNLESLHLIIDGDAEASKFPALDSTLTGISRENCLRLFEDSTDADVETLDDDPSSKLRRETELKGLKVNESILDLPKLKELNMRIKHEFEISQVGYNAAYKICVENAQSRVSRVSHLYALKLVPGLKYKIIGHAAW